MHQQFYQSLINKDKSVGDRYFCVFQLKNIGTDEAIKCLMNAYPYCGTSILLKHQLLYALGQLPKNNYKLVKEFLIQKMEDPTENNLSRHEAAQALANYFDQTIIPYYKKHLDSQCIQLKHTCMIALQKLSNPKFIPLYGKKFHSTLQPAAPLTHSQLLCLLSSLPQPNLSTLSPPLSTPNYLSLLCCPNLTLFQKYRLMYYMRNLATPECIHSLCLILSTQYYKTQCSLLKHEICFILGQIGIGEWQALIRQCIENQAEEDIVRHEALAAVASQSKDKQYLERFLDGKYSQLIRESAEVAIHSILYWNQE